MSRKWSVSVIVAVFSVGGVLLVLINAPRPRSENSNLPLANGSAARKSEGFPPQFTSGGRSSNTEPTTASTREPELSAVSAPPPAHPALAATNVVLPPADPDPSGLPPETVMENVRSVFRQYASRFGGNPVGTNPEITAALKGGNPGEVQFVKNEDGLRVNDKGELIDSWGTPYFFHQLSGTEMEIHSAGPDRRMWTADDLIIK